MSKDVSMDKETKNFFERLSGINRASGDEPEEETEEGELGESEDESESEDIEEEIEGQLAVDVYETPASFIVKSAVAGVAPENLDISITNEAVTIKGERSSEEKVKTESYLHQECYWGKFSRSVILPQEIDADRAQASLKNGILKISLPKFSKSRSKKLKIKFE